MRRSVANTDRNGNGNSGCKRYAYRDCNCYGNSNLYFKPAAYSYSHAKEYPDAQTSADPAAKTVRRARVDT